VLFENYGLYYERKRGEFSDGIHYGYLPSELVVNREKLVRVSLACDYRVNQARSSIAKFFNQGAIADVLRIKDAGKYAYGYGVLVRLDEKRKAKSKTKGDRYHTKEFGQALRYGQYAVVTVCTNRGMAARKSEVQAIEAILSQWRKFEKWAARQSTNANYKIGRSFDYVNYYKGATINADLQTYAFKI